MAVGVHENKQKGFTEEGEEIDLILTSGWSRSLPTLLWSSVYTVSMSALIVTLLGAARLPF